MALRPGFTGCHCCIMGDSSCATLHFRGFSPIAGGRGRLPRITAPPDSTQRHTNPSDTIRPTMCAARLLICQNEFQYFNLSRRLQPSAGGRSVWGRAEKRDEQSITIKVCYSRIDFLLLCYCVCVCVCVWIPILHHYICAIANQMFKQTSLDDE